MRYFLIFILFPTLSIAQQKTVAFKTWDGELMASEQLEKLKADGNIVHIMDTLVNSDSVIYSIYYYHESKFYSELKKIHINTLLPEFELRDIYGNKLKSSELIGQPMMINFWSVVCAPCIAEMPDLNKLEKEFGEQIKFIAIAPDQSNEVLRILEKHQFNFTQLVDGQAYLNDLKINGFPVNLFIDKTGQIIEVTEGTPVEMNNGEITRIDGKWKTLVYEGYSEIIKKML